jgi:hypothetical protein
MTSSSEQLHGAGAMTPEKFSQIQEAMRKREERAPKVGDEAPDFELPLLHGDGKTLRLSDLRSRPVALVFGSYT